MSKMPLVISIVRGPDQLTALIGSQSESAWVPVVQVHKAGYPSKERLVESWRRLGEVKAADENALYDIFIVLLETVPDLGACKPTTPLPPRWNAPAPAPTATAAHPRTYRGTKFQPPKAATLPQTDVRSHLCDARSLKALVAPLWKFKARVRSRLARIGYSESALDAVAAECGPQTNGSAPWNLPPLFVQYLWRSARLRPEPEQSRLLSLFSALQMEADRPLLIEFARLVVEAGTTAACAWGSIVQTLPPHRRLICFQKLTGANASVTVPEHDAAKCLEETSRLATDEQFRVWLDHLLTVLARDSSAAYLLAGFRLAAQFDPSDKFGEVGWCADFPEQDVVEIALRLDGPKWLALSLWCRCGRLPGLAAVIRESQWRSFAPPAAYSYFRFLMGFDFWDMPEHMFQKKWASIAQLLPEIEALLLATCTEYQEKVVEYISDWVSCWDAPAIILRRLRRGFPLLRRLASPPFETAANSERPVMYFLELEDEEISRRFFAAPDASFQSMEAACRRDSDAVLIARGLEQLTYFQPSFTVDCFVTEPGRLFRTAKMLGSVSGPIRAQIINQCKEHIFFRTDPRQTPVRELCALISVNNGGRQDNPIPARLSAWMRGEVELSQAQLDRHRRVLSERFVLTRLGIIEESVLEWLKRGFPADPATKPDEHALRMLGTLRENRRGLRNFLSAYWAGDRHYLANHPATLAWYRKHDRVPRDVWEQGIPFRSESHSIVVERDPFEVLKLGTYVGSCLAIGGMYTDSAVAALLDANKRVLYVRDGRNRVVARQLVAISDEDSLVCFSVYPLSASKEVKALFRNYDHAFAKALGLPLFLPSDSDDSSYQISSVLSLVWWDDHSWDFQVSDGEADS